MRKFIPASTHVDLQLQPQRRHKVFLLKTLPAALIERRAVEAVIWGMPAVTLIFLIK